MSVVWKYELKPISVGAIQMPEGAMVLSLAFQGEKLQLWAEVEPDAEVEKRRFAVLATGFDDVPDRAAFIGTAFHQDGLVFHIYELVS